MVVFHVQKVKDDIKRDLEITDITASDLRDEIIGPIIIKEYQEQVPRRMEDGGYEYFSMLY